MRSALGDAPHAPRQLPLGHLLHGLQVPALRQGVDQLAAEEVHGEASVDPDVVPDADPLAEVRVPGVAHRVDEESTRAQHPSDLGDGGLEVTGEDLFTWPHQESSPGNIKLTNMLNRRDWVKFKQFYTSRELQTGKQATAFPATTGPLTWRGQEAIETDIANLKAGLDAVGLEKRFITSIAPGSGARVPNSYYKTEEEHIYAAWEDVCTWTSASPSLSPWRREQRWRRRSCGDESSRL